MTFFERNIACDYKPREFFSKCNDRLLASNTTRMAHHLRKDTTGTDATLTTGIAS